MASPARITAYIYSLHCTLTRAENSMSDAPIATSSEVTQSRLRSDQEAEVG
jgi:hypothetical protein